LVNSITYNTENDEASVNLNVDGNFNNITVVFEYDSTEVDYSAFSSIQVGSGNYVNATEVNPTSATFNFNSLTLQNSELDLGNVIFNYNETKGDISISTKYSFDGVNWNYGPTIILSPTAIGDELVPTKFSLSQNYPNPFNPSTTINFALPISTEVSLKVFDILGREIATLVNEQMAQGIHTIQFDAKHLASGVYFYQLEAGKFRTVKKMMLLK